MRSVVLFVFLILLAVSTAERFKRRERHGRHEKGGRGNEKRRPHPPKGARLVFEKKRRY